MKADVLKFVACYFLGTLEILFSQNPGTKVMHGRYLLDFSNQIPQVKSIFRTQKIVDEKLRSVSFHNNLVASSNIQNWCREAALNTGPYAGGKTRRYFLRLKTSGRCSKEGAKAKTSAQSHAPALQPHRLAHRRDGRGPF